MFRKWLQENRIEDFNFCSPLFPKGSDREFWETKSNKKYIDEAIKYLNNEWPNIKASDYMAFHINGNRLRQENPHFLRRYALVSLLLGELCEYNGRFIPDITDGLFLICEETYWGLSAHYPAYFETSKLPDAKNCYIDLFAGETASTVALCYYLLYDELYDYCPDILTRIEYEMKRRILDPYLEHTDFFWMGYYNSVNNWNPWVLSNMLTAFLLMENNPATKYKAIRKMMYEINNIYTAYPDDGGCDEGANYWELSGGTLFEFIYQLYISSGKKLNLFNDKKIQKIMQYNYHTYIADGKYVNFADGTPHVTSSSIAALLYLYGKVADDLKMCELAKRLYKDYVVGNLDVEQNKASYTKRKIQMLILSDKLSEKDNMTVLDKHIYPRLQIAYMRSGEWYCAAKGGHNSESHNHNDVGSFMLYYGAVPVLMDPGCGVYTANTFNEHRYEIWTMQSDWHNLPKINGVSQHDGFDFRADSFEMNDNIIRISFKNAYTADSGLTECTRNLQLKNNTLNISDKFVFEMDENTVYEHFIIRFEPNIDGNKAVFGDYVLECDPEGNISYDVRPFDGDSKLINSWNTDKLYRIIIKYDAAKKLENKITIRKV